MTTLEQEIDAYEAMRADLEEKYFDKWIIVRNTKVAGAFDSSEECIQFAVEHFGRGPYLVRQVGEPPMRLPAYPLIGALCGHVSCWGLAPLAHGGP